jgi:aminotransferase
MTLDTIKKMERIARNSSTVISLGQGIPSENLHSSLQQCAVETILSGRADAYSDPQGLIELREEISRQCAEENMHYQANETIVTVGAIEAINVALRSVITNKRNEVIVITPAYSAYFKLIQIAGGTVKQVATSARNDWGLPLEALRDSITNKTAAVLLSSPNNPTGKIYSKAELDELARYIADSKSTLIIDEVYRHISFGKQVYSPCESEEFKDFIIRVMSLSKDFNMTGWRIGYIQSSQRAINAMTQLHDAFVNCAPVVSQYVAIEALKESKSIYQDNLLKYAQRRGQMERLLKRCSEKLVYKRPDAGYFYFVKILNGSSHDDAHALARAGVIVIPGEAFGQSGEGYLRICFGRSPESIENGMQKILKYYNVQ